MGWGGRWEGGSGWGTHVNPWLILVNVLQKPLQYCKVISVQLIKLNEKKKTKLKCLCLNKNEFYLKYLYCSFITFINLNFNTLYMSVFLNRL